MRFHKEQIDIIIQPRYAPESRFEMRTRTLLGLGRAYLVLDRRLSELLRGSASPGKASLAVRERGQS
jgi:hypothetical protein